MKTKDAILFAGGSTALAKLLSVTPGAISQWSEFPPPFRQLQLQALTLGKLRAEPGVFEKKPDDLSGEAAP